MRGLGRVLICPNRRAQWSAQYAYCRDQHHAYCNHKHDPQNARCAVELNIHRFLGLSIGHLVLAPNQCEPGGSVPRMRLLWAASKGGTASARPSATTVKATKSGQTSILNDQSSARVVDTSWRTIRLTCSGLTTRLRARLLPRCLGCSSQLPNQILR
jgi:hypothetical protein